MLKLTDVTLIALTNKDIPAHEEALKKSSEGIEWGARKIILDYDCTSIDVWNYKIIYELPKYVETSHAFLFHADGYVINPYLWRKDWLDYDYVGAPWPLPTDHFSYRDERKNLRRVGNSVSLRSKRLMDLVASRPTDWFWEQKRRYGNTNEDGFISCHNAVWLEEQGCRFAPLEEAIHFSKEHEIPENKGLKTFAFHQVDI